MADLFEQDRTSFEDVDRAERSDTFAGYLTRMASDLADTKRRLHDLLAVEPGDTVLDVGCGTGADVRALSERVGPTGRVIGVDNSRVLIEEARAQSAGHILPVDFRDGDAEDLPFEAEQFDAVRSERVLMHLNDPDRGLRELIRVAKPGARILVADPDHGMWALDNPDAEVTRRLFTWWFGFIANPWIARGMPARFRTLGLRDVRVTMLPVMLYDLDAANAMTGVGKAAEAGARAGVLTEAERFAFDRELTARDEDGRFFMCGAILATTGVRP